MQGRAAGGAIERSAQGLAVDRQHAGPLGPEVVEERLRPEQPDQPESKE